MQQTASNPRVKTTSTAEAKSVINKAVVTRDLIKIAQIAKNAGEKTTKGTESKKVTAMATTAHWEQTKTKAQKEWDDFFNGKLKLVSDEELEDLLGPKDCSHGGQAETIGQEAVVNETGGTQHLEATNDTANVANVDDVAVQKVPEQVAAAKTECKMAVVHHIEKKATKEAEAAKTNCQGATDDKMIYRE